MENLRGITLLRQGKTACLCGAETPFSKMPKNRKFHIFCTHWIVLRPRRYNRDSKQKRRFCMEIEILEQQCGGTEFVPSPHRLHLGAQNAEGVDRLQFILPAAWAECTLALYLRRSDGVQLAAIPLAPALPG